MSSARREEVAPKGIYEEVDSVFEIVFEAMQHREGGLGR
ncbi:MAG: hypothetical protein EOQ52_12695 [Mesorhizobium sp.]|nr:MAG: hypothetical protein EOQ52_12695 [Mesorhizobium sp.]